MVCQLAGQVCAGEVKPVIDRLREVQLRGGEMSAAIVECKKMMRVYNNPEHRLVGNNKSDEQ